MRTALQSRPSLDCIAIAHFLKLETGVDGLPLDVILNQASEAAPGSAAVAATAGRILLSAHPLSGIDQLLTLAVPTVSCLAVAATVLKEVRVVHPLSETSDVLQAWAMPAYDIRVGDDTLILNFVSDSPRIRNAGAIILLDFIRPTLSWIVCSLKSVFDQPHEVTLKPILKRYANNSQMPHAVEYSADGQKIMAELRAPRTNINPAFIPVPNTILDSTIAIVVSDPAEVLAGRLMESIA
jgi:hypothetical protein